jgi:hypothetical protein
MERIMVDGMVILLVLTAISLTGAEMPIPFQVMPQGLESVNGSTSNMGCAGPLVDMDGIMCCGGPNISSVSYLSNGYSPEINPYIPNWASELVTVRKNEPTNDAQYPHVVLTFGFDAGVNPTAIELDVFLCPEWNISAPYISVFGDEVNKLVFMSHGGTKDFQVNYQPSNTSCGCLSTVRLPFEPGEPPHATWHIVVSFHIQPLVQWVHVGEVRFLDTPIESGSSPTTECRLPDPIPNPRSSVMSTSLKTPVTSTSTITTPINTPVNVASVSSTPTNTLISSAAMSSSTLTNKPISSTSISSTSTTRQVISPSMNSTYTPTTTPVDSASMNSSTLLAL